MVARSRSAARPDIEATTACLADGVSKVYGRRDTAVRALRDVTLRIPSGEFTAIMGPSGSGKSTLLHCLAALDTPTSGRVFLGRTELTALSRRQQAQVRRDRIGFVFQAFNLVPTLDAIENITLPQLLAGRRPDTAWLDYVVAQIGLSDRLHHRPSELSGGQQQRVALARALAGRPEVIFADEPTGNLDTAASEEMLRLLRDAVDQFNQTVVTVTHDPTIAGHADRVLFFRDGRVVDEADRPDVDHVLARLRDLDRIGGGAGDGDEPGRSDRQDSMRSRRRRQPDEQTPGRPMVGSDDEIEVARQERWLERIRQQFDSERVSAEDGGHQAHQPDDGADGGATAPTILPDGRETDPPARKTPTAPAIQYTLGHGGEPPSPSVHRNDPAPLAAATDDSARTQDPPAEARRPDVVAPELTTTGGWLPPERSWAEIGAGEDPPVDDRDTAPSEPVPWSRPETDYELEPETASTPHQEGSDADPDPWAPPDRSTAEEYHIGMGGARRPRGWRATHDDVWTTGGFAAYDGRGEANGTHLGNGAHPTDEGEPVTPPRDAAPGRHVTDAHDRAPLPWERHGGDERKGSEQSGAPADPWSAVWDADEAPGTADVWAPSFDTSPPAPDDEAGPVSEESRPAASDDPASTSSPEEPADADDEPRHEGPSTGQEPTAATLPAPASHVDETNLDQQPATAGPWEPVSPVPGLEPSATNSHAGTMGHANGGDPAPDDASAIPPPLASLRNTRRQDPTADPLAALQSLQAQLERLGAGGRRPAGPVPSPTGTRDSGTDADRPDQA